MAAVSALARQQLIDVYAKEGLPFPPGPFGGGRFELLTGKSDHSPPDQIDAVFKKVILFPKSYHLPPPFITFRGIGPLWVQPADLFFRDLRLAAPMPFRFDA